VASSELLAALRLPIAVGPPEPGPVNDQVRRIMSGGAYDYTPSVLQRFLDWIGGFFDDLFNVGVGGGGAFGGGIGGVVAWLMIAAAVAAIVAVIVVAVRQRRRSTRAEVERGIAEVEHRRPASDWRRDAEAHEAAGEWKDAMRARYRELVRTLVDRRQLPDVAGLTTGELRGELAATTPDASVPFDVASSLFEVAWYGDRPTGVAENQQVRAAAEQVLAATVIAPVWGVESVVASGDAGRVEVSS
jgi:hypothetical protein